MTLRMWSFAAVLALVGQICAAEMPGATGETTVLKWKDGKKAVFVLAFDDGAPTHLSTVIPELEKRKFVGTFYLVTGNSLFKNLRMKWHAAAKSPSVVLANHTFTHTGVSSLDQLEPELSQCNEVLAKLLPDLKTPRLIAFGKPGGVPWKVTDAELKLALEKNALVYRPPFFGPPIHCKSAAEMIKAVDVALDKGEMGHLDFHGVGGDWIVTPADWFIALLEKLEAHKQQLWITDTISWHQYATERKGAVVKVLQADGKTVRIELTCSADPKLYELPLTLATRLPAEWKQCLVEQGTQKAVVPVLNGVAQYAARPGGGEIRIRTAD